MPAGRIPVRSPKADLDIAPDAVDVGEAEESLASCDTTCVILGGYASDSAVTAASLSRSAVRSSSCTGSFLSSHEAANPDGRRCTSKSKSISPTKKRQCLMSAITSGLKPM